ncbi:IclR family transcriptional regulator [Brevibacillus sp. LEMMJ03]|uniref:IclR family transcriptional regulator n=1 Tax=Brevibacillus sp. LEMMJ03 TaxID=2595056 RepID=UPI00117FE47C|nr:IclR family transcriptional regulator [Brevibacillus sp. LEMMJ03]TRY27647.1 IclR family transcriptional regulator [Brevibacillus sp. LEMMJ03]
MEKTVRDASSVQSVDRALYILDLLKEHNDGLGITELAHRMDVAKSTVHRLLTSLKNQGYVRQDPLTERYLLGLKLIELGSIVTQSLEIRTIAKPILNQLVQETGETSHLVILEDGEVVYIEKIESPYTIRMYSLIGKRAPVHCTGVGKAIIAYLPEEQVRRIAAQRGLKKFTENTITSLDDLLVHLQEIKANGYSLDREEHEPGICCVAAPILNHNGEAVAGVSVSGPTMRMNEEKLAFCKDRVVFYAREISKHLGYRG